MIHDRTLEMCFSKSVLAIEFKGDLLGKYWIDRENSRAGV
jgi:hypothetical protein